MRQSIERTGFSYTDFTDKADFYIINTCTVTGKTDARCRNAIRRARKLNPEAVIIATGCYVDTQWDALDEMDAVDFSVENRHKNQIHKLMRLVREKGTKTGINPYYSLSTDFNEPLERFHGHSRAFIKIQEGCDAFCSYCIIPYARGRSRSADPESVLGQIRKLYSNGYEEIVLTGIHIGRYGENSGHDTDLAGLLKMILDGTDHLRLRLSSIEVMEVTKGLIEIFSKTDRIASHFHIPLQSGDDTILEKMNRTYRAGDFKNKILSIAESVPNAAIGTDIIVGFPGEKEEHFQNTYDLLESMAAVNYFHVFSYSVRPGTKAAGFPEKVRAEAKKERSRILIELGKKKREEFIKSQIGSKELALVQGIGDIRKGLYKSLTGNYCEVLINANEELEGKLSPVIIEDLVEGQLIGRINKTET